jgi:uncharacterized protein YegJ (DUF2314 family)
MWKRVKSIFKRPSKEPLFVAIHNEDAEMRAAYKAAAATVERFVSFVREGGDLTCAVKLRLRDPGLSEKLGEDRFVFLWLAGVELEGAESFLGTFFETPSELREWYRPGERVRFTRKDIVDWFVNVNGLLYGGFTMRVQRSRLPEAEHDAFDEYTGVREWIAMEAH